MGGIISDCIFWVDSGMTLDQVRRKLDAEANKQHITWEQASEAYIKASDFYYKKITDRR